MKASDLLVKALENEGVEYIWGIPGEENLDLLESLRASRIKLIVTRHEQAAGFMAATYGRLTGKTGVCLSTLGPGATNFVTASAYAHLGGFPMLMITGQKPIHRSKQGKFQIIDTVEILAPVTKYSERIEAGDRVAEMVRNAFKIAEEERPGAVHLELPEDVAAEETADDFVFPIEKVRRPVPEEKAIEKALRMIESAKSPLILVGAGANRKRVSKWLQNFIEKTKIPYFCTQMGKGVVPGKSAYYLGTAALSESDYVHRVVEASDLIINVGHDVIEKPPFFMRKEGPKVIHCNFSPARVDQIYFPQLEVVGDLGNTFWQMHESIKPQSHWDFAAFDAVKDRMHHNAEVKKNDSSFPVIPQRFVEDVHRVYGENGIVCLDNGMYKIWFARNYRTHHPNSLLLDNALATMGAGLPSAMAAKMIHPEKPVIAVCGDGGFMMNSQEIETALRLQLNLTILILNDSAYGMIKWKQDLDDMPDFGLDFNNPDFVKYAESYGARGYRIEKTEDLYPQLKKCSETPGVHLIDCPIDYSENETFLNCEILGKCKTKPA
jgi:acetolactate synthase I/II/III large subunit